jgi:catechol 2,3-dioxygenase-like lactoylglutathione lyase family enzyme
MTVNRRTFIASLPALAYGPGLIAQTGAAPFRATGLSQLTLTVSDVAKSLDFYQGLFGMPVQARQGSTVLLRIGTGPKFLELRPAAAGERPSISALGFAVEKFDIDRAVKTLNEHGLMAAAAGADKPAAMQYVVRTRKADLGGSSDGTRELFVADPSGVLFQMHDVSYCGGSGAQGSTCRTVEPSKRKGVMAVTDMSHFTVNANDPRTVPFYQELFGFQPQAYQAATPAWGVGDGVHFLMFTGNAGGPTRGGGPGAPPRAGGPPAGAPPAIPAGAPPRGSPAGGPGRRGPGPARAGIDHACMAMPDFDPAKVTQMLVDYGLTKQDGQGRTPLVPISRSGCRIAAAPRAGHPSSTSPIRTASPIQLQDVKYCGGGGFLRRGVSPPCSLP